MATTLVVAVPAAARECEPVQTDTHWEFVCAEAHWSYNGDFVYARGSHWTTAAPADSVDGWLYVDGVLEDTCNTIGILYTCGTLGDTAEHPASGCHGVAAVTEALTVKAIHTISMGDGC